MYLAHVARRAGGELVAVARATTPTHGHLRDRVAAIILATTAVDGVAAALAYLLERGEKATEITTYGDALFWTTTQLLTVSSSIKNPISTGARFLDAGLELYAITVVATLAGSFGAFFHRRGRERDAEEQRTAAKR